MHVLGKPVGRHLMAEAALLRLAVDEGARGRELIAEADIVDEASHLGLRLATFGSTGDELRQGRKLVEVDLLRQLPAAARHLLLDHDVLGGDVNRARIVPVNDDAVGALDGLDLDFRAFDRAQMHPRLDPALEKNVVDGIGRAHDDVGALDRLLRLADGYDLHAKHRAHGRRETFAALRIRAKATDRLDVAHGAGRHQLRARLPAGAEKAEALRVGAGEVFYAEPIGRADAHALHDAVGQDRERLAVLHREQQHQSDIAVVGRRRDLFSTHGVAALGPSHDVGIDAHRADAELRRHAVHGFEAVERVRPRRRREAVGAGARDPASIGQLDIGLLHDRDAFTHRQKLLDIVVGADQRHGYCACGGCDSMAGTSHRGSRHRLPARGALIAHSRGFARCVREHPQGARVGPAKCSRMNGAPSPSASQGNELMSVDTHVTTLSAAFDDYPHTLPLKRGEIKSPRVAFTFSDIRPANRFFKPMVRELKFDVSEMAIATYVQAKAYGKPLVLVPATMMGRFQHGTILCNAARALTPAELAAAIYGADLPNDPTLKSVIPDAETVAQTWYARHHVVPINHMVVVTEKLAKSNPQIVEEIYRLLLQAKTAAGLPKAGAIDFLAFGLKACRPALQTIITYALQQRLIPRKIEVEELFDDTTRALD